MIGLNCSTWASAILWGLAGTSTGAQRVGWRAKSSAESTDCERSTFGLPRGHCFAPERKGSRTRLCAGSGLTYEQMFCRITSTPVLSWEC